MQIFAHGNIIDNTHKYFHICRSPPRMESDSEVEIEMQVEMESACQAVEEEMDAWCVLMIT